LPQKTQRARMLYEVLKDYFALFVDY